MHEVDANIEALIISHSNPVSSNNVRPSSFETPNVSWLGALRLDLCKASVRTRVVSGNCVSCVCVGREFDSGLIATR